MLRFYGRIANRLRVLPLLLRDIIPYFGNIVNKKSERRRFRRRFLRPYSDPKRRARDSLFIRFPGCFTVTAVLPQTSSNTEKAASGFPFSFFHIPEARPPGFPVSILPLSFPRLLRPLSGAAAYSFYKQFFSTYYYI